MRKDSTTARLTETEIEGNKKISKSRYIVEHYFGISHLKNNAKRVRFTEMRKNKGRLLVPASGLQYFKWPQDS